MIDAAIVSFAIVATGLLYLYRRRRFCIAAFARRATLGSRSQDDAAFALARTIFSNVKRGQDPPFVTRLLAPLGASPPCVLDREACCSGITRLFIASLDTIGIRSAQITVYRQPGPVGVHCLAQVEIAGARTIIDVDYGVWLKHPNGGPIELRELRAGVTPIIERFVFDKEAPYAGSAKTRPSGYPDGDYYRFDFSQTRTANWTMSALRRVVYRVLNRVTEGRVNYFLLPPVLEWPEVLLALSLYALALMCIAAKTMYAIVVGFALPGP